MIKLPIKQSAFNRWMVFVSISLTITLLLALRPFPSIFSSNDTGRYLVELHNFCEGTLDDVGGRARQMGRVFLYNISGSCLFRVERLFLFFAAFSIPAAYLCFAQWKRDDLIVAFSALLSVYGLELMINALRSGFALFFFLGALQLGSRRLSISAIFFALAGILHTSLLIFFPLLYYVWYRSQNRRMAHWLALAIFLLILLQIITNFSGLAALFSEAGNIGQRYALIYGRQTNNLFVVFMLSPMLAVVLARALWDRARISRLEILSAIYSSLLLFFAFLIFPLVAYRFALLCVPIQLFTMILSEERPIKAARPILAFLVSHLLVMILASSYFDELIS